MLRLSVLLLSPLLSIALFYWAGVYALLGCFALALGTIVFSTAGPRTRTKAVAADEADCPHGTLRRRHARMVRS